MNALSLQSYREYFVDGLKKELCALECINMHTKCETDIKTLLWHFSIIKMKKMPTYTEGL